MIVARLWSGLGVARVHASQGYWAFAAYSSVYFARDQLLAVTISDDDSPRSSARRATRSERAPLAPSKAAARHGLRSDHRVHTNSSNSSFRRLFDFPGYTRDAVVPDVENLSDPDEYFSDDHDQSRDEPHPRPIPFLERPETPQTMPQNPSSSEPNVEPVEAQPVQTEFASVLQLMQQTFQQQSAQTQLMHDQLTQMKADNDGLKSSQTCYYRS